MRLPRNKRTLSIFAPLLLRRDAGRNRLLSANVRKTFGEAFAFRIDQRCRAGACDRIDGAGDLNATRKCGFDHMTFDGAEIVGPALVRVPIAFDQAGAFGHFERQPG